MTSRVVLLLLIFCNVVSSQIKDTVFGSVKNIKVEITFLNKSKQNYRIFENDGDYGHSGFISNKFTKDRFYNNWYETSIVHYINYSESYDSVGKPIEEIWFYKNGDVLMKYNYLYNKNGKLTQIKEFDNYLSNDFTSINYSYDDYSGLLRTKLRYVSDMPNSYELESYFYNDKNKLVESNRINSNAEKSGWRFFYDEKGRIINKNKLDYIFYQYLENGVSTYSIRNKYIEKTNEIYRYNDKDRLIETQYYCNNPNNENETECCNKIKNYYSKSGKIEYIVTSSVTDTITSIVIHKYDKLDRLIEKSYVVKKFATNSKELVFNKGKLVFEGLIFPDSVFLIYKQLKYIYKNGYISELKEIDAFDNIVTTICTFEYKFDNKNNWIEQIKAVNGERLYVLKRDIIYND